ncbi:MAG: D-amino acid aminotransferase [Armatimonadota bacterium]|nr:D-amino acid aminotransferase [Armatimonadota bacterium]MDR7428383.1 D-amino acid aminotransferase [Armatimonadota bacterium]MDR7470816.1 D-amino acid aminotransferase [Armatimonadota bacterium]MDR7475938.1 D-amino acid aminotransferase [Armatimonadota bacterium]MDR7539531.1 D-amino acid aminotransferase [Armatimonadota bacterium]
MSGLAYVNGAISSIEEARVSVEDRGLQFGDSVYEVVHFERGRYFRLGPHLERLARSLQAIDLAPPLPLAEIAEEAQRLLATSGLTQGVLYIQVTRGTAARQHAFPRGARPTLIMTLREAPPPDEGLATRGARLITHPDLRWARCDIKTTALLANVLAREQAARAGAEEALLYRPEGTITECTAANFFAVIDGVVRTHPADTWILQGVTRAAVLDLCRALEIPCREVALRLSDLPAAAEAFITSTGIQVLPVGQIDQEWRRAPGEVTARLRQAYRELVQRETGVP